MGKQQKRSSDALRGSPGVGGSALADVQEYKTIEGRAEAEIIEKKSRFIGQLAHVETEEQALAFLDEIRTLHIQARHNVYAYILRGEGSTPRIRYSDDGEPGGTAGMPVLEALQHEELFDVACVVTRYFGGTLLGTGGLVRAYTQATQAAIGVAHLVIVSACVDIALTVPYSLYEQVMRTAESCNAKVLETDFADNVALKLRMIEGTQAPLLTKLSELTRGQSDISVSAPYLANF